MDARGDIEYNGKWRFPEYNSLMHRNPFQECVGTLYYNNTKNSILEVYHKPNNPSIRTITEMSCTYSTVWGSDAYGDVFTLFNLKMISQEISKTVFSVEYCLVGKNVKSIDAPIFDVCIVHFPYLRNWTFEPLRNIVSEKGFLVTKLNTKNEPQILEWNIEDNITLQLHRDYIVNNTRYETTIKEDTLLLIKSKELLSVRKFLKQIHIFKQFLSIALYGEQNPCRIEFRIASETNREATRLLYRIEDSYEPYVVPLLQYDKISNKVSDILKKWYSDYEQMSPICDYLIQSTHRGCFDAPNFLVIAQALDGYYKRFVNKKKQEYKKQIELLLEHFENVDLLQKCKIDAEVLKQSRHKYSHLIPDDDEKMQQALSGEALHRLTRKAMVLLVCCILDNLGLTTDEINNCLNESEIARYIDRISFYED